MPWSFTNVWGRDPSHDGCSVSEGRGIARALMTFLESHAASSGYSSIRLDAFTQNPRAVRFYDRCEYRRAGQVRFRKGDFTCSEKELRRAG